MVAARRPGGLTALAVINFVMSGLSLIGILGLLVIVTMADTLKASAHSAQDRRVIEALDGVNMGLWGMILVTSILAMALLIASGVGYLKMRKWGRYAGNIYAVMSLVVQGLEAALLPEEAGGGFQIGTIIGIVWPVLTLLFLNITFKDDLTG